MNTAADPDEAATNTFDPLVPRPIDRPTVLPAGGRIEIADLKERVRKLEAIAAGIDL